jgi:CBS domain containing-hemolysin-like protein
VGWIIGLLMVNAIFVVGKFSFAKLRREYIEELVENEKPNAKYILRLYQKPNMFLGAAQLGISLSMIGLGVTVVNMLLYLYNWSIQGIGSGATAWVTLLCGLALLSICVIVQWVLGELIPKSIGLQYAERSLFAVAYFIHLFSQILYVFILFGNWLGHLLLKTMNIRVTNEVDMVHSEDEIRMLVTASHRGGKIDQVESELIDNVFDFVDRLAKEVMVPRQDVVCLYTEDDMDIYLKTINSSKHTRYPLCDEDKDHIVGMVHIKDVMNAYLSGETDLRVISRDILIVPEVMHVSNLLQVMRKRRVYLAIVVDEYGGTVGLVGLEDILEELVGDIQDEHDAEGEPIVEKIDGSCEFDGTVLIDDVEDLLHIPVNEDLDADTIGGYVFSLLERTPCVGDVVNIGHYQFRVLEVQGFRISRVEAVPLATLDTKESENEEK